MIFREEYNCSTRDLSRGLQLYRGENIFRSRDVFLRPEINCHILFIFIEFRWNYFIES